MFIHTSAWFHRNPPSLGCTKVGRELILHCQKLSCWFLYISVCSSLIFLMYFKISWRVCAGGGGGGKPQYGVVWNSCPDPSISLWIIHFFLNGNLFSDNFSLTRPSPNPHSLSTVHLYSVNLLVMLLWIKKKICSKDYLKELLYFVLLSHSFNSELLVYAIS